MNVPIQFPMVFGAVQHLQHNSFACAHARFEFNDAPPCIQLCRNLTADLLMTTANEHWPYALTNCACVPSRAERRSPYISDSNKQINREKKQQQQMFVIQNWTKTRNVWEEIERVLNASAQRENVCAAAEQCNTASLNGHLALEGNGERSFRCGYFWAVYIFQTTKSFVRAQCNGI